MAPWNCSYPSGSGAAERGCVIKTARVAALPPVAENRILASSRSRRTGIQPLYAEGARVEARGSRGSSVSDLPRRAVTRTAKLATLPVGLAGRTAWGLGKRLGGRPAEIVAHEIQQRTAEQIFKVLGELKGGALKFGQALSIFEAALPPEIAGPYRATLTKLQESAPPLPASTVHRVLAEDLGPDWRDQFAEFDDKPTAAASI